MLRNTQFLSSLRHPGFRLLWTSLFLSSISMGSENVLLASLMLELTDSSFLFGVIMSLRFAPYLMGPMTGVFADRIDRRKLMVIFKLTQIAIALILGTLIIEGQIQLWHIVLIILLQSIIQTFNFPAQSAFIVDLVGKEDVTNATALHWISMNVSGVVGPSLVGVFVNNIGIGPFYYLNAAFYLIAVVFLLMIRPVSKIRVEEQKSVLKDLVDGFKYSSGNRAVFGGQIIYFITNLFPIACRRTLMWVFADNILHLDTAGLGWLSSGNMLGSFVATACIAFLGNVKGKGRVVVVSSLLWGGIWILFASSTSFFAALLYIFMLGIVSSLTLVLAQVILLIYTDAEMRGRVMGIRSMAISSQFPGSILAGAMSETLGDSLAVGLEGVFFIISILIIMKLMPTLQRTN